MPKEIQSELKAFLDSLSDVSWLDQAGSPHPNWIVVADAAEGYDDWRTQKVATWTRFSHLLEAKAQTTLTDSKIDETFASVSEFVSPAVADGLQRYYNRRPDINENTATNADLGLWPEILDDIKRDLAWAAVETILKQPGFFMSLLGYYSAGRWPCSWDGEYPDGRVVVL